MVTIETWEVLDGIGLVRRFKKAVSKIEQVRKEWEAKVARGEFDPEQTGLWQYLDDRIGNEENHDEAYKPVQI